MRTLIRLLIFAAVVAAIALTIAPPIRSAASLEASEATLQAAVQADGLTGTYAGTITPDAPGDMPDQGAIVVGRDGERWTASAGPDAGTQFPAGTVTRTVDGLAVEVPLEGGEGRLLRFDLKMDGREMTGTLALLRDGTLSTGRIAFTKQ